LEQVRKELNDFKRKSLNVSNNKEELSTQDVLNFALSLENELENSLFSRLSSRVEPLVINENQKLPEGQNGSENQKEPEDQKTQEGQEIKIEDIEEDRLKIKLTEFEEQLKRQSDVIVSLNLELEKQKSNTISLPLPKLEEKNQPENKEGYLVKQGQIVKSWKKRFFFFQSELLYYAKSKEDRFKTIGCIPLINSTCRQTEVPGKHFSFIIETKDRSYYLVAASDREMKDWIVAVQKYIKNLNS